MIERKPAETVTAGGIILPDTSHKRPEEGTVIATGPGEYTEDGVLVPASVQVGDWVLFAEYSITPVKDDLFIIESDAILATVN